MSDQKRTPAGVPTGGQFAASARAESDVFLGKAPDSKAYRSVEEDHEFFDALALRGAIDTDAEAAIEHWEAATANIAWWRPGSKKKAAKARGRASMAVSRKSLNDSTIRSYTLRHGVPDWAERFRTSPDTDQS